MHLVGLGYKHLEHRLRSFLLTTLGLRKELCQEEALKLQALLLPFSPNTHRKRIMAISEHLGKRMDTEHSLKVTGELAYSVRNCHLYAADLGTVRCMKRSSLRMV